MAKQMGHFVRLFIFFFVTVSFISPVHCKTEHKAHLTTGWYEQTPTRLHAQVDKHLQTAAQQFSVPVVSADVRALVVPHAGYRYAGICSAAAYATLLHDGQKNRHIKRVIILAPSHYHTFTGVSLPDYDSYTTHLGSIKVDSAAVEKLKKSELFSIVAQAHRPEHSLEMQLPFLQKTVASFSIVPLIIGNATREQYQAIARQLDSVIDETTLVIVSTDLIHYGKRFDFQPVRSNVSSYIFQHDVGVIQALLQQSSRMLDTALGVNSRELTVCGRSPLRLWMQLLPSFKTELTSYLACYYTSAQLEQAQTEERIDWKKLLRPVPDAQLRSSVSYASLVFANKPVGKDGASPLTGFEKRSLLTRARTSIEEKFDVPPGYEVIKTDGLRQQAGSFVTLNTATDRLRGCIGHITVAGTPLYKTVASVAQSSAFDDSRFSPVKRDELDALNIEVSVLTQPRRVRSHQSIDINKHGIILEKKVSSGRLARSVYLPSVATDQGWDLPTTLQHLSRKAGLNSDGYKTANFKVFRAIKFKE